MATTTFIDDSTVVYSSWLNDVDALVYDVFGGVSTVATARAALGLDTGDSPTFTGLTLTGNLSVQGNTTVGNAAGDALTFNPSAWTLSNSVTITGTWANLGTVTTVDINGGAIDGTTIGATSASTGAFTTLSASGASTLAGGSSSGTWTDLGSVTTIDINGGTIDGTAIGGATPAAGAFTTLSASGLISANGGQVAFPASQNASADANTLDDYEEGTWTPSLGGTATYNANDGIYVKIGQLVFISGLIDVATIGTGSTTTVSGLPFAPTSGNPRGNINISYIASAASSVNDLGGLADGAGGTTFIVYSRTSAAADSGTNAIFQNATVMHFSGCYRAAA